MIRSFQRLQRRLLGPARESRPPTRSVPVSSETSGGRPPFSALLAGLLLALLHLLLFPPVPRLGVDVLPEEGGIAEEDLRAPFAFEAPLVTQDVEMRRIQKVLEEPPVLRRLEPARQQSDLSRLEVFAESLRQTRTMVDLTTDEQRQLLSAQYPYLEAREIHRALTVADFEAMLVAMATAVEKVTAPGVADMLPPGQYNRVLVVDDQAESLRELTAITPQGNLLEVLTEALFEVLIAPIAARRTIVSLSAMAFTRRGTAGRLAFPISPSA